MEAETSDFLSQGVSTYLELLRTLHHFRMEIQRIARHALTSHIDQLSEALGSSLVARIEDYEKPSETNAWVAVKIQCPAPINWLYLGILWEILSDGTEARVVVADFDAGNAPAREKLLRFATNVVPPCKFKVVYGGWNEVQMRMNISPEETPQLEDKLGALLDEWSRLFRGIGGVQQLQREPKLT